MDLVDASLKESYLSHEVQRCIQIGLLCVQDEANDRPNMLAVVLMLNGETALPSPKQPAYHFRKSFADFNSVASRGLCSINEVTVSIVQAR